MVPYYLLALSMCVTIKPQKANTGLQILPIYQIILFAFIIHHSKIVVTLNILLDLWSEMAFLSKYF